VLKHPLDWLAGGTVIPFELVVGVGDQQGFLDPTPAGAVDLVVTAGGIDVNGQGAVVVLRSREGIEAMVSPFADKGFAVLDRELLVPEGFQLGVRGTGAIPSLSLRGFLIRSRAALQRGRA
jgi:hypothetical protein